MARPHFWCRLRVGDGGFEDPVVEPLDDGVRDGGEVFGVLPVVGDEGLERRRVAGLVLVPESHRLPPVQVGPVPTDAEGPLDILEAPRQAHPLARVAQIDVGQVEREVKGPLEEGDVELGAVECHKESGVRELRG